MAEILLQFNLTASAFFLWRYLTKKKWHSVLFFNLFLSAAAFTKPVIYPFIFPVFLFQVGWFVCEKRKLLTPLSFIPLLLVLSYCGYNYKRTGYFHFSSIQLKNLIDYNIYLHMASRTDFEQATLRKDMLYAASMAKNGYGEQMKFLNKEASKYIINNLPSYAYFHLKGSLRFFLDPGRFDLATLTHAEDNQPTGFLHFIQNHTLKESISFFFSLRPFWLLPVLMLLLIVNILRAGGIILYSIRGFKQLVLQYFLLGLILYTAIAVGPLGASRFFVPLIPITSAMAALGILNLFSAKTS